jgi:hypothetical protein
VTHANPVLWWAVGCHRQVANFLLRIFIFLSSKIHSQNTINFICNLHQSLLEFQIHNLLLRKNIGKESVARFYKETTSLFFYTQGIMPLHLDISFIITSQAPNSYLLYIEITDTFCAHTHGHQNKKDQREKSKPTNIFYSFIIFTNKQSPAISLTNSNKKPGKQSIWWS